MTIFDLPNINFYKFRPWNQNFDFKNKKNWQILTLCTLIWTNFDLKPQFWPLNQNDDLKRQILTLKTKKSTIFDLANINFLQISTLKPKFWL